MPDDGDQSPSREMTILDMAAGLACNCKLDNTMTIGYGLDVSGWHLRTVAERNSAMENPYTEQNIRAKPMIISILTAALQFSFVP